MYCNPETKETAELDELRRRLNASIPEGAEEAGGWHLVHFGEAPAAGENETAVPDEIVERDGIYVQTYKIVENPEPYVPMHGATLEDRIYAVESGLAEIAQMLANGRE